MNVKFGKSKITFTYPFWHGILSCRTCGDCRWTLPSTIGEELQYSTSRLSILLICYNCITIRKLKVYQYVLVSDMSWPAPTVSEHYVIPKDFNYE